MGKKKIKAAAVALAAAAVTVTAPGTYIPGMVTAMAAVQTENFTEIATGTELLNAISTGSGSYKLTADLNVNGIKVPANSNITIDLNGHSLKTYWNLSGSAGSSLHLMDSSADQTGTMTSYNKSCLFYIGANVQLTIDSGNYICEEAIKTDSMFAAVTHAIEGSQIVINGGNFRMESVGDLATRAMFDNFVVAFVQTVINGGTFSAVDGTYVFRAKTNQTIQEALQNVTINGGTFEENTQDPKNAALEGPKA